MHLIAEAGGALIVLMFVHFFADWVLQTDDMARRKADESPWLLVVHSTVYAVAFIPILLHAFRFSPSLVASSFLALLMSHGAIDTYTPLWLWARLIRRPQEMRDDPVGGFTAWSSKPYGMLLTSGLDQFMHISFLVPVALMTVVAKDRLHEARMIGLATLGASVGMAVLSIAVILLWNKTKPSAKPNVSVPETDDDHDRPSMPSQHDI